MSASGGNVSGDFLTPSAPAEKTSARCDQARQARTDHGAIVICFHCVVVRKEGGGVEKSLPHKRN